MTSLKLNVILVIIIYAWECYGSTNDTKEEAHLVIDNKKTKESTLLLQIKEEEKGDKNLCYLDNHMCGYKDNFVELDEKIIYPLLESLIKRIWFCL